MFKPYASSVLCGLIVVALGCTPKSAVDISASASGGRSNTTESAAEGTTDPPSSQNQTSSHSQTSSKNKTIGFSAMNLANPFFQVIADTLTAEAKQHGFDVIVEDAATQPKAQSEHLDSFIAQQVTAIVLNPCDRYSAGPAIKRANEAGIPVFTCDLQCIAEDAKVAAHVGTDNYGGGKLAGEAMIEALGEGGGKVFVIHFPQANSCVLRVDGFKEVIAAYNENRTEGRIEIVGEQDGGGDQNIGFAAASAAIQSNPDLAGIFAINDPSGLGAYRALEQAKKTDQVKIVAFDGQTDGKYAIKEGKIYADPIQFPKKMAVMTMENIMKNLRGEEYEAVVLIPTALYRQADAEKDPELQ